MNKLYDYLQTSLSPYHAVEGGSKLLQESGFVPLLEGDMWQIKEGGKYFVVRGGSLIAFTVGSEHIFRIAASHTDSPCFKLKANPAMQGDFTRLNVEPYGGGIWYSFFDRPLKLAGRVIEKVEGGLRAALYTSEQTFVIPSLAVHQNRDVNDKFSPDLQTDTLPLYALGSVPFCAAGAAHYDLFLAPCEAPFEHGAKGEFFSSPRIDNLTSVYASLTALTKSAGSGINVAACLESEEIGSRTQGGAGSDFLKNVLARISLALKRTKEEHLRALAGSLLVSVDNAHSVHPNRPEKCDPTNRAILGGGVVIKAHAGGAYTTNALTAATFAQLLERANVKYQLFYNRSDVRSGSTLGAISLGEVSIPSVDVGIAQLAMHSAVETACRADVESMQNALLALFDSRVHMKSDGADL